MHPRQPPLMTIELLGAPGSPYSRKMLALLRYRRIPYAVRWGSHRDPVPPGYPVPKVKLLPTFYFRGESGIEAVVDSTPIISRLDSDIAERRVRPLDPALHFLDLLLEDHADEWVTKAMFHYRWAHARDADNAAPLLVHWRDTAVPDRAAQAEAEHLKKRQIDRLYVVGSNDITKATIESSFERLITLLDARLADRGFVLGARPASCDFAYYGQLTQLGIVEPTPAALLATRSPRLRGWIDRMEDLSGLEPQDHDWLADTSALRPLLREVGRTYAPFMLANASAAASGSEEVVADIDGRVWRQPTFPYQNKCLQALRDEYAALPVRARARIDETLAGTGCEALFAEPSMPA